MTPDPFSESLRSAAAPIMLEDLCVNLDTALMLQEAGWRKKTIFVWSHRPRDPLTWVVRPTMPPKAGRAIAAPTAIELADELPENLEIERSNGKYRVLERNNLSGVQRAIGGMRYEILQTALADLWLTLYGRK